MDTKHAYHHGGREETPYLYGGISQLSDLHREVEGAIRNIEKLVRRTRWLSAADRVFVFDWIEAQEKAAGDFYRFVRERTQQVKDDIMRAIDADKID